MVLQNFASSGVCVCEILMDTKSMAFHDDHSDDEIIHCIGN